MTLLAVGSIAFDDIQTPSGRAENVLGGSVVHFSSAARHFAPVRVVGVVGEDFPEAHLDFLRGLGVDTEGVRRVEGRTFRWCGRYTGAMNEAETLSVELNCFEDFQPRVPEAYRDSLYVFLANGSPVTQRCVLDQFPEARLKVADTMNLWIDTAREALEDLISALDLLFINEGEVRMLTGKTNLVEAGEAVLDRGARGVVVKKGEHGAMLVTRETCVALPAFPVSRVVDPTGAGDSFAGGFMGFLAAAGDLEPETVKRALAHAMVAASFNVEDFSVRRLAALRKGEFEARFDRYADMLRFG